MSADVPGASKRLRSPTQSGACCGMLGWAEYDVDLLDNVRRNKRFAVNVSFSADLASKMSMGGPTSSGAQSPPRSVNRQPAPATAEPMCVSAECSPAATPGTCGAADPGPGGPHPLGWSTPQRPVALGSVAGLSLTSPSDPGPGGYNLRKMALRRVALGMVRSRGASTALAPTGGASPDSGSPMALGAAATPAVGRPRSRLAQPGGQEGVGSATGAAPMDARRSHDTSRMSVGPG